jgi:hypothetical protein
MLGGSLCHHSMARPRLVNILNKQPQTNDKGWPSSLGVGRGANKRKKKLVTKQLTESRTSADSLAKGAKRRNMDMRFGTWNVRSMYRAGSVMTVSREYPDIG